MNQVRLLPVGGFLGSGKTTFLARIARCLEAGGEHVALLTQRSGPNLVDTQLLRCDGFAVGEVIRRRFCCEFDVLARVLHVATNANDATAAGGARRKLHRPFRHRAPAPKATVP